MSKPVYGSPTAETSLSRRLVPQAVLAHAASPCCQEGAADSVLHPPPPAAKRLNSSREGRPLLFHTVSLLRAPVSVSCSDVPPVATTEGSEAGESGSSGAKPRSAMKSQLR